VIPPRAVVWLIVGALGLPIALCVLMGLAWLLRMMQDEAGAACLGRVATGLAIAWVVDLIALVVIQAINSLGGPPSSRSAGE
jgi:hypothetical protein